MLAINFLLFSLSFKCAIASLGRRPLARRGAHTPVSALAGSPTSFDYPPPNATSIASSFFPDASQVGYGGSTPTGDEAAAIQTAPAISKVDDVYPLVAPASADRNAKDFNVLRYLGDYSPMYSVDSFGLPEASAQIPEGCQLKQVHILHRHGARYPDSAGIGPAALAAKIFKASSSDGFTATGALDFLNNWTYKLGEELLTPFGREQMFTLGVGSRVQYGDLLKGFNELPVFRTTSNDRMVDSALNFAAGFFGVRTYKTDYHQLITVENGGINNTLASPETCDNANNPNIGGLGTALAQKWIAKYLAPATTRLAPMVHGVDLNIIDIFEMQLTCAYETVALGYSKFCDLFTEDEWRGFEYATDIQFWYSFGPGQPTSAASGIGYVQELISRLTQTRITEFNSTVNGTIVSSDTLFPLDQPIYVDATHDSTFGPILTALNFTSLAANGPLPTDHIPKNQSYVSSQIIPFASRLVGQVVSCPASGSATHIRFVLNDAVLPLTGIKNCKEDKDGLCDLSTFITSIHERIGEIDFAFDCKANYTVPNPDTIIDGRYPKYLRNGTA